MLLIPVENKPVADARPDGSLAGLAGWLTGTVLPFWLRVAHDGVRGHFHEALGLDACPLPDAVLRTRTAARMIHVYADAALLGIGPPGGLDAARFAAEALERDASDASGGYVRSFNRDTGATVDPVRDLYDQACVLLAHATLLRTTGAALYRERADRLLADIERLFPDECDGWAEDEHATLPRRQNPHMHLFEALLVLVGVTGDTRHMDWLRRCETLLHRRFLVDNRLREYFGPCWELGADWGSERLDPGHMAEWAFLLHTARPLLGAGNAPLPEQLMRVALSAGLSAQHPSFLVDEVDADGHPLSDGRRLWLQFEQIKGCLVTGRHARADAVAGAILADYVGPAVSGIWIDRFSLDGTPCASTVPASSCYHAWTVVGHLRREAGRHARRLAVAGRA